MQTVYKEAKAFNSGPYKKRVEIYEKFVSEYEKLAKVPATLGSDHSYAIGAFYYVVGMQVKDSSAELKRVRASLRGILKDLKKRPQSYIIAHMKQVRMIDNTASYMKEYYTSSFVDHDKFQALVEKAKLAFQRIEKIYLEHRDKNGALRDKKAANEWLIDQFLKTIRIRLLKKGTRLYRGTKDPTDPIMSKGFIYFFDNPFAYHHLEGVQVEYMHEYRITRDVYIMDFVSHADICRPEFKKLLQQYDLPKKRDRDPNQFLTDPQPSKYLQLRYYQLKKILGHTAIAHLDCPSDISSVQPVMLQDRLKKNKRPGVLGFPEFVFYNQLPILKGLKVIEHVRTYTVPFKKYKGDFFWMYKNKDIENFYKDYSSPELVSPSKVSPAKKRKAKVPSPNLKSKSPIINQAKVDSTKLNSKNKAIPVRTLEQKRAYYTKIRAKARKLPVTAKLSEEQLEAVIGKYAAYWPEEGCLESTGHYVGYSTDHFPRCYKARSGKAGKKAIQEVYDRSKDEPFYGFAKEKVRVMESLLK